MSTAATKIDLSKSGDAIFNQNAYGTSQQSCVFDSIWGALKIQGRQCGTDIDISVQFGYNDTWLSMGRTLPANTGLVAGYAYDQTLLKGLPDAATFTYGLGNQYVTPPTAVYAEAATQKITSFASLNIYQSYTGLVRTVGEQLAQGKPVLIIGDNMKFADGSLTGPHAFLAVGIDDATQLVKVQNSIGRDWGDGGYGYIKYQDFTTAGGLNQMNVINGFDDMDYTITASTIKAAQLYVILDRAAELSGLRHHENLLNAGMTDTQIAQAFVDSAEYASRYGSDNNEQFVTQMFDNLMGRAPDQGGFDFYVGSLNNGASRGGILASTINHLVTNVGGDSHVILNKTEVVLAAAPMQIDESHYDILSHALDNVTPDYSSVEIAKIWLAESLYLI